MFKAVLSCILLASLIGCTSVRPLTFKTVHDYGDGCKVTVYPSKAEAEKGGYFEPLCEIKGSSSGSLTHNVETAVKKNADEACECGTDKAYVSYSQPAGYKVAYVTMIAFEYKDPPALIVAASTPAVVVVRNVVPAINGPEALLLAERECQKNGKHAMQIQDNQPDGIATFECK